MINCTAVAVPPSLASACCTSRQRSRVPPLLLPLVPFSSSSGSRLAASASAALCSASPSLAVGKRTDEGRCAPQPAQAMRSACKGNTGESKLVTTGLSPAG